MWKKWLPRAHCNSGGSRNAASSDLARELRVRSCMDAGYEIMGNVTKLGVVSGFPLTPERQSELLQQGVLWDGRPPQRTSSSTEGTSAQGLSLTPPLTPILIDVMQTRDR